jgi:3-methylcrotonyl-CoA carboxylase alpha subunit
MFASLLIANRGEIACRVIRTAKRMGLRTIAVFSDADAGALHVAMADAAIHIGPAPARESYLHIARIIEAARASGADAIHPGYGFLSENAAFAEACAQAGIIFVGPPPAAMRAMGSKAAAKALMDTAGVPLVPGYHGEDQSDATLRAAAHGIGFPILVKASAGGGGKGMRVANDAAELDGAIALAKGEAASAFGDDRLLLERYLTRPRHIEIQVFADTHGNVVSLFERDCSIQRRHQKVVEEAPAPGMSPERRQAMGQAACDAARAIGYVGAGTVEFISTDENFFFMEMNTRLQVEHPVTEAITGLDLVEWQLRVAAGEALPRDPPAINGHAIEVRLYAEDPARDFVPSVGMLRHLVLPADVRVDAGVRAGDSIPIHYDPMIAKIIAHGANREEARRRLSRALAATEVVGVRTNLALLRGIVAHSAFAAAELDTGFLARHPIAPPAATPRAALAAAVLRLLRDEPVTDPADPHSPWGLASAWRLSGTGWQDFSLATTDDTFTLRAELGDSLRLDGADIEGARWDGDAVAFMLEGRAIRARVLRDGDALDVVLDGATHALRHHDPRAPAEAAETAGGRVIAPMPGRVLRLLVAVGDRVARGDVLLLIEAMKVQMRITAPADGTIAAIGCAAGELVEDGAELVTLAEPA